MTSADNPKEIEQKIVYSILSKNPKRAEIYWFMHIRTLDDPYTIEYKVTHIMPNCIIWVEFRFGFRIEPRISLMFRKVVEDLAKNKEIYIHSSRESLGGNKELDDLQFIVMEKYLSSDIKELPCLYSGIFLQLVCWQAAVNVRNNT